MASQGEKLRSSFNEVKIRCDLYWWLDCWKDIEILLKTVKVVFRDGANNFYLQSYIRREMSVSLYYWFKGFLLSIRRIWNRWKNWRISRWQHTILCCLACQMKILLSLALRKTSLSTMEPLLQHRCTQYRLAAPSLRYCGGPDKAIELKVEAAHEKQTDHC